MSAKADNMAVVVPERLYFKIGEVSRITRVKPYILRYWESEFKIVSPQKTKGNQRMYKRADVELVLQIKKLLIEEKYTLEGAKKRIKEIRKEPAKPQMALPFTDKSYAKALETIREDLASIKSLLSR
ncbi:MAG: MerR family transcriptional regulator [Deltaproteobacteria bacterium]|nr:MerR family transcriptional regulator [Deltaproteobacteria bacterium]